MRRGGLFVNVADIPGYFSYSFALTRRIEAKGADQNFYEVPLMRRLGLKAVNWEKTLLERRWAFQFETGSDLNSESATMYVTRLAALQTGLRSLVRPCISLNGTEMTPMFFQPYGRGGMLCSLFFLGDKWPENRAAERFLLKAIGVYLDDLRVWS